jgi:hypothetical protein
MTPDELRSVMAYVQDRVQLGPTDSDGQVTISFQAPTGGEMADAGLHAGGSNRLLSVPWWDEMVEEIVETPEMCEPDDAPEQVLQYARDVVAEYIRKRFPLEDI